MSIHAHELHQIYVPFVAPTEAIAHAKGLCVVNQAVALSGDLARVFTAQSKGHIEVADGGRAPLRLREY